MKLLHTMIRVADIEKSLKFYTELMGLKVDRKMELEKAKATLYFLTDDEGKYEIELTYNHETPEGGYTEGTKFGHFAFGTDDMKAFSTKLKGFGLEYTREPFFIKDDLQIAFVNDPDGNAIEIIERA